MTDSIAVLDIRTRNRRQKMPFFCAYHLGIKVGRRMGERRITARGEPVYVDRYAGHLILCAVAILFLSTLDAFLTLNILANGGKELNWFMAVLIEDSTEKFVAFKLALTSLALILLIIHHEAHLFKGIRVRHINYSILAGYAILIGYELHLIALAMSSY
ncbi:MAG: hypothetical protein KF839_01550 [Nitrosomonas sp.]|nr:hypothetical protein [Nitrosomonas sp.]